MATKKKVEKEKTEAAFRREFIEKCYEMVMKEVLKNTKQLRKSTRLQVMTKNYNKYIIILKYGQKLCISLFTSGDIDVKLDEICHSEHKERIFEYSTDPLERQHFLERFREILKWLIPFGFGEGIVDMHTYMDYLHGIGIVEAYELVKEDWKR